MDAPATCCNCDLQENLKSSANMRKSRVNFREAEVSGEVSGSRASLRSGNDLSKARAAPRAEAALSIKEKIDLVRSSVSVRGDHAVKSNAEMRKSLASLRMEQSTYSLRSLANDELPEIGKWSEVEKSCLSLKSAAAAAQEPAAKPKNIFDDEDEKLEGCEKVLESKGRSLFWLLAGRRPSFAPRFVSYFEGP